MTPAARSTDPATSKEAAASVTNLRASQARVLSMFRLYGDMDDKTLERYLHEAEKQAGIKPMSPSGIRSRRSELTKPNIDRLAEIYREISGIGIGPSDVHRMLSAAEEAGEAWVRWRDEGLRRLRTEGFKSPLIDTGRRAIVDGRTVIIWGLAT